MTNVALIAPSLLVAGAAFGVLLFALRTPLGRWGMLGAAASTILLHGAYAALLLLPERALDLLPLAFVGGLLQATCVLHFAQSALLRLTTNHRDLGTRLWLMRLGLACAWGALLYVPGALYWQGAALDGLTGGDVTSWDSSSSWATASPYAVHLGALGQLVYGGLLVSSLWAIAKLEQLLRRARDPLRYQLKFVVLGLGALCLLSVYVASVFLLQRVWEAQFAVLHSCASLCCLLLVLVGLLRLRHRVEWPALAEPAGAYGSLSFLIVGIYLLAMGVGSALLPPGGTALSHYVLGVTVASTAAIALVVLLTSRYVRTLLAQFFVRTFKRAKYDYRKHWLAVTGAFRGAVAVDELLNRLQELLARSFRAQRMSIWLPSSSDLRFSQRKSINYEPAPAPLPSDHALLRRLRQSPEAIRVTEDLRRDDDFFRITKAELIVPIWADTALGFVALSGTPGGAAYDRDDIDLLQAVCNHVGVLIAHAQLAEEQRVGEKIRAFHEFSMFCIHDLKNLAGRLSLVAQNAKRFGDDPEFQASALRTVSSTVEHTTALIDKLSTGFGEATAEAASTGLGDVFKALDAASDTMKPGVIVHLPARSQPAAPVRMNQQALTSVLLNVITNAEQALGDVGEIQVNLTLHPAELKLAIRDDGPGIPPEILAELFQPLRSSKKSGLGVGLYQCKRMMQAVGGNITVTSELGRGTCVTLILPRAQGGEA